MYGFLLHPFMGYFLGTHRSGGEGFRAKASDGYDVLEEGAGGVDAEAEERGAEDAACQPTMSTYSLWSSLPSLWLTHHVEHHDFPGVPWSRLAAVTAAAPEYYAGLEQSPGFCATMWRWAQYSGGWGYACQYVENSLFKPPKWPVKPKHAHFSLLILLDS